MSLDSVIPLIECQEGAGLRGSLAMDDLVQRGAPRKTVLQGDVRSALLWQRWQGLRSTAHQTGDSGDIAKADDAWDDWLVSYLPNPADRVPIPRPVIPFRAH